MHIILLAASLIPACMFSNFLPNYALFTHNRRTINALFSTLTHKINVRLLRFPSLVPSLSPPYQRPRTNEGWRSALDGTSSVVPEESPTLRKSAAHRIKKRTLHYKKCVLTKPLTESLKKLTPCLKQLTLYTSFAFLRTLSMPLCLLAPNPIRLLLVCKLKNARKSAFFLLNQKKCCNFAAQSWAIDFADIL